MSKHRVVVLKIVAKQLTVAEASVEYGISRRHLHRLLARFHTEGLDGLQPRSRRPRSNSAATSQTVHDRITGLRQKLTAQGLDAGPVTIAWHLEREGLPVLSAKSWPPTRSTRPATTGAIR